ncbi:MAG TPA: hypothetical protein VF784_09500 [Anaerolineales bacterium]
MNRYSLFLILAGIAVGLFLGFNPTTHRDLARWWNTEATGTAVQQRQAERTPAPLISLRQIDNSMARLFRTAPRPQTNVHSQPATLPGWSQIVAALQSLWHALQRIWLSLMAKFAGARS